MTPRKTRKSAPSLTEIVVLLDRSGSMSSIRQDMIGGFDGFMAEQKKLPGKCVVTLTQFDSQGIDTLYEAKPIADVPSLALDPRGGTPLLDAMGQSVTRTVDRITDKRTVLFLVITDGHENASHEFRKEQVKKLVDQQTAKGWVFSFLGANVDAFAEANALGISASSTANYVPDAKGTQHAYMAMSVATANLRAGGTYTVSNRDPRVAQAPKNPAAQSLGKLGGAKGGYARANALTEAERGDIARKAAAARWGNK